MTTKREARGRVSRRAIHRPANTPTVNRMLYFKTFESVLKVIIIAFASFAHLSWSLFCKVTPSSPDWPSELQWQALNQSVSGRLIKPIPLGAACHASFNKPLSDQACGLVQANWKDANFHAQDPASAIRGRHCGVLLRRAFGHHRTPHDRWNVRDTIRLLVGATDECNANASDH